MVRRFGSLPFSAFFFFFSGIFGAVCFFALGASLASPSLVSPFP
jgi:hypothetical protein